MTHSRIGLTPKPQHLEGGIKALMREMPSLLLPDLGDDLGITVRDQYVLGVRTLPCWQEPLPQPRYPDGDGPRARRKQYWCPPGCYAGVLASRYHLLPFTHVLAFEAPAGVFEDWWDQWLDCLVDWWVLTASLPFPEQAIWLGAMADRPGVRIPGSGEDPHVHLLVGNVPETAILAAAARWPQAPPGVKPWLTVTPLDHVWGKLHYTLTQSPVKKTASFYMTRRKLAHFKNQDALILPLIESPTLEAYTQFQRHRLALHRSQTFGRTRGLDLVNRRKPMWCVLNDVVYQIPPAPLARAQRDTVKLAVLLFTLAQVRDQEIAA